MKFVETTAFTRRADGLLAPESVRAIQLALVKRPDLGTLVPGLGGIRKLRWGSLGRGKRGGARIIYFWAVDRDTILLLYLFAKNEQADLTPRQKGHLLETVRKEFG